MKSFDNVNDPVRQLEHTWASCWLIGRLKHRSRVGLIKRERESGRSRIHKFSPRTSHRPTMWLKSHQEQNKTRIKIRTPSATQSTSDLQYECLFTGSRSDQNKCQVRMATFRIRIVCHRHPERANCKCQALSGWLDGALVFIYSAYNPYIFKTRS